MERTKICLTLTGKTIAENLQTLKKYRQYIDMAELRADFLEDDEKLYVRKFPRLAGLPSILTVRRKIDGGQFDEGEASRTIIFGKALSFAGEDSQDNFDYVDFEEDFRVPSLQDAVHAFGTKIIRSVHDMKNPVRNLRERLESLNASGVEIPKIAFMPHSLKDVQDLFEQAQGLKDFNHILVAMGPLGTPSRILGSKLKNFLTYTSPSETTGNLSCLSHLDPVTLNDVYHFRNITESTELFGITGWPLSATSSPEVHNKAYAEKKLDCVYIPFRSEKFYDALSFATAVGIKGFSVTIPHKESAAKEADIVDEKVSAIGASNTMVFKDGKWFAYNTDAPGFARSLLEFTGLKNLKHKKVSVIGAGGASRGIVYALSELGAKVCIFNRTLSKAKELAVKYGFDYALLDTASADKIKKYSDIIIQTTSKGMGEKGPSNSENDPIYFYDFSGKELLLDIVYHPAVTPVMKRASESGCKVLNGYDMLKYQAYEQFKLFTGTDIN
ncbi:MAG: shikimate dehydrogenase [Treponema sp.]|nr:shikimate dehydrogenase [Treponema sp.]